MDNLTHTLTGIALGQAGLKRKSRYAMLALILASNIPDIDIITRARGSLAYLEHHRGISHSLIGFTVLSAALALGVFAFARRAKPRPGAPPASLKWLLIVCWIGAAAHVLMDFSNDYGVRPFLPFSGRWFALNIVPVIDMWLLLALILGLCIPGVLRLVGEEVGVRRENAASGRRGAIVALCAVAALWGARGISHHRALALLGASTYGGENPTAIGAFPSFSNPFDWRGVVETDSAFYLMDTGAMTSDFDGGGAVILRKPPPSAALSAAKQSITAQAFLNFARLPYAVVYADENDFRVYLRDLRFARPGSQDWNFTAEIVVGNDLKVKSQRFYFILPRPVY